MAEVRVGGVDLRVVGMHLDLSGLWRRRQAHAILAHLAGRDGDPEAPTVLMGDLNEWSAPGGCLRDLAHQHRFAASRRISHSPRPTAKPARIKAHTEREILASAAHQRPPT